MPGYRELFERNYGIFSEAEQDRIRRACVLIIGCGGIGGTVAVILARSGVGRFILVEFDSYDYSNMNRQIGCFDDTLGRNKAEIIGEQILRINPEASVEVHAKMLAPDELAELIPKVDVVFPAADDFALSIIVFRDAQRLGKPALLIVPSGTWSHVSIIDPDSPPVEDIEGVPKLSSYEELHALFTTPRYKFGTYFYVPIADWRIDYYRSFIFDGAPPAQLCPAVWLASSLGSFEILKVVSGKWKPVVSPRYWSITRKGISIKRIHGPYLETLFVWQRKIMWRMFQTWLSLPLEVGQKVWWHIFYGWYKYREGKKST